MQNKLRLIRGIHPMGEWRTLRHWNFRGGLLEILHNVMERPVGHDQRAYSTNMLWYANTKGVFLSNDHVQDFIFLQQGRPVNVKQGAICAMGKDKVGEDKKNKRGWILMYYYKFAVIGQLSLIIMAWMLVGLVYYCAFDISDYIVLARCKMCSIVMLSGIYNFRLGDNLVGTAVTTIGML